MSTPAIHEAEEICASCGKGGGDNNIKLKNCTACFLVKYCGVECQRNHRSQHKRACKKRAAELKDELLFKQPESRDLGDCPICLLPIPMVTSQDTVKYTVQSCCSKVVCDGCIYANQLRQIEARLKPSCPFCRHPVPATNTEADLNQKKRAEANDPLALHDEGMDSFYAGDYATAIKYCEKAAALGHIQSHYHLSTLYFEGAVVEKDTKKFVYHAEQAAIGGHPMARYNLGVVEFEKGNIERAAKHWIIAANLGYDLSIESLKDCYSRGVISKEVFATALRAHQAAVEAMKSSQRDAAEAARKKI
eukprot:scaffold13729_cov126-Skeletonema_menzelii.AAC.4